MTTTLTSKGQVTIPKQIRDALNMEPGCSVQFHVNQEHAAVLGCPLLTRDARRYQNYFPRVKLINP